MNRTGLYLITWYFKSNSELAFESSLHGMNTSDRPEALGNLDDIPGKERLVSFAPWQPPMSA